MGLKDDGNMAVISKCVEGDDGFYVIGELVVALSHVHTHLKRAIDACDGHPVFIVTPWPRFVCTPCCSDSGHVTNFNNADFLSTILGDLNKHKGALRRAVPTATIIDGLELISGPGYNTERPPRSSTAAGPSTQCIRASMSMQRWCSTYWKRLRLRTCTAVNSGSTAGNGLGAPATTENPAAAW
jgi:hypothetical protein